MVYNSHYILTTNVVCVVQWLPKYKWSVDFSKDLIAGITVGCMLIPQGRLYHIYHPLDIAKQY